MHIQVEYTATATSASKAVLAAAMAAVPVPTDQLDVLDMTVSSDVTVQTAHGAQRTIQMLVGGAGPVPNGDLSVQFPEWLQSVLEQALSTLVVSAAVVVF